MKKIAFITILILLCYSFSVDKFDKKINKRLSKEYPDIELTKKFIGETEKNIFWYKLTNKQNNKLKGYMGVTQAPSRSSQFEYMILFTPEKKIKSIKLLTYREEYGGEIGSKRWLKQFIDKSDKTPLRLNKEIDGIAGATISCNSMTKSVSDMTVKIHSIE